ncbi:MAG: lysylphosphatidylglycerol synthase transmembrane domain-containing protein [Acidobacteriota bacterium]
MDPAAGVDVAEPPLEESTAPGEPAEGAEAPKGEKAATVDKSKARLAFLLRLAATVALVAALFRLVDGRAFLAALVGADLRFLLGIVLLRPALYGVRAWRFWHLADAACERPLPRGPAMWWHFVSLNLGTFTPAGLGEVSLVYFMRRRGHGAGPTVVAMVLDKVITLAMVSAMGLVGAVLYLGLDRAWLAAAALLGLGLLAASEPVRRGLRRLRPSGDGKVARAVDALDPIFAFARRHPLALLVNIGAAAVQSLIFTAQIWLGFRMLGHVVDFMGIFWLSGVGRLANMLPVTLGGLGVYEGSMVLLFGRLGAQAEAALAAVLLPRTLTWIVAGAVIAGFVWWRGGGER